MKKNTGTWIAFALILACAIVYRFGFIQQAYGLSSSTVQFILTPFVLLSFLLIRIGSLRFPLWIVAVSATSILCLGFVSLQHAPAPRKHIDKVQLFIAPFVGDTRESQTIRYSDLLAKELSEAHVPVAMENLANPLSARSDVAKFMLERTTNSSGSEATVIISGNARWLSLGISPRFGDQLVSHELETLLSDLGLQVVKTLGFTGLSSAFEPASREYVMHLLAALVALSKEDRESAEKSVASAAGVVSRWSSNDHRAFALWMLGTLYLERSLSSGRVQPAYLECAVTYFDRARNFIVKPDNKELLAAIANNRGIAQFLQYVLLGRKNLRAKAIRGFKAASNLASRNSTFGLSQPAWAIGRENFYSIVKPKNVRKRFNKKRRMMLRSQGRAEAPVRVKTAKP